jgi:transposase
MWKPTEKLSITEEQRATLKAWVAAKTSPQRTVLRARICLLAAEGLPTRVIARSLKTSRPTVIQWRKRFEEQGPQGLAEDAPHGLSSRALPTEKVKAIVEATLHTTPADATHWSTRTMAQAMGVSNATVSRIWDAHGLQPHRVEGFKLSKDRRFTEKLTDVVGVYLNPPDKAVVLCVDEKSQVQALDRTQPGLPMKKGRCGTMTHDYKRNGTTTLFAALSMLDGSVIGDCMPRHRHQEFIRFLKRIDAEMPASLDLHLVVDNYGTHKHPRVRSWLERHPRFHLHFTPTSSSWLNMVERWFREITDKRLRRSSFANVRSLINVINDYIHNHNQNPQAFVWTATPEAIMKKIVKCKEALGTLH